MVKPRIILSDADRERLRKTIQTGEARSSAELVLVIADSCGSYGLFALLWPALAALLVGGALTLAVPQLAASRAFLVEAGVFASLCAVLQWPPALLRVVPHPVRHAHARHVAEHQFALRVHARTRDRNGVLLLVALAERQVLILPDAGVAALIAEAAWRSIVEHLVAAMRTFAPADAIAQAITETMTLLERHFPPSVGAENELPDAVVQLPPRSDNDSGVTEGGVV